MSLEASKWLLEEGLKSAIEQLSHGGSPYILAGTSRGASTAATATTNDLNCKGLIMILPLGINTLSSAKYVSRVIIDHIINLAFLDGESRISAHHLLQEVISHAKSPEGLIAALKLAMNLTPLVSKSIKKIYDEKKLLGIFAGINDKVFPLAECEKGLQDILNLPPDTNLVTPVPGGHTAIASKAGQIQLKAVATWLSAKY